MIALTINDPVIESYFSNSADKLKEFLERFVRDDTLFTEENKKQYEEAVKDLADKQTISSDKARQILGI